MFLEASNWNEVFLYDYIYVRQLLSPAILWGGVCPERTYCRKLEITVVGRGKRFSLGCGWVEENPLLEFEGLVFEFCIPLLDSKVRKVNLSFMVYWWGTEQNFRKMHCTFSATWNCSFGIASSANLFLTLHSLCLCIHPVLRYLNFHILLTLYVIWEMVSR